MAIKKFEKLEGVSVYPSNVETIEFMNDDFNGAHRYRIKLSRGYNQTKKRVDYSDKKTVIQFIQKNADGSVIPGLQDEQLILVMMDRLKKLDAKFHSDTVTKKMKALQDYLDACKERFDERREKGITNVLKD